MTTLDRLSAWWCWNLGRSRIENPFRESTPHHLAFRAGVEGRAFPSTLVPEKNEDPA